MTAPDETPTPETDAVAGPVPVFKPENEYVWADFARRLERERDEARRERDERMSRTDKEMAIADLRLMRGEIAEARKLILSAIEMMTLEQVSNWTGVRAWLEGVLSDQCPCCGREGCWNCGQDAPQQTEGGE